MHKMHRLTMAAFALGLLFDAAPVAAQSTSAPTAASHPHGRVNDAQLARELAREQAARRSLVARIEAIARELDRSRALGDEERRRLEGELELTMRRLTETHARVAVDLGSRMLIERRPAVATTEVRRLLSDAQRRLTSAARIGYVGITLSPTNNHVRVEDSGELYVRYFDHPSIISIEPSSPAERAGLARGDVVLSYNDMDVRQELPMHELLRPGNEVRVRVRRGDRDRNVRLTVAPPPANVQGRRADFLVAPGEVRWKTRSMPLTRGALAPDAPGSVTWTPAPRAPEAGLLYRVEMARGVAGAEMTPVTGGLAAALGVRKGLLVIRVAPRSPAGAAGLRDGDIVLEANGHVVEDIASLSRIMRDQDADSRTVTLETLRAKRKRVVTLSW